MNRLFSKFNDFIIREEKNLVAYALLSLVCFSTYASALSFPLADGDDLVIISSVEKASTPLKYFFGDWGMGNNAYRPLHSLTIWIFYRLFGISSGTNQLFSLVLHCIVICLLFRLIRQVQPDIVISFLVAGLSLASIYTFSSATWISDRPTLLVALFFLLLLNHLYKNGQPNSGRISYIVSLSILALLSKESGLILPLFVIYYALTLKQSDFNRLKLILLSIIIIAVYLFLRWAVFRADMNSYAEAGYIFGVIPYDDNSLPKYLQYYAYVENVIKNIIAPFLPIFNGYGGLTIHTVISRSPIWLLTGLLIINSIRRKLSHFQKLALVIIFLNSIIHYTVFRDRIQYLSQLAISMFIAASPVIENKILRKNIVMISAAILFFGNIILASHTTSIELISRYKTIINYDLSPVVEAFYPKIDNQIVAQIIKKYKW